MPVFFSVYILNVTDENHNTCYTTYYCAYIIFSVKSRTAQQAKMKWIVNIVFYILQVGGWL